MSDKPFDPNAPQDPSAEGAGASNGSGNPANGASENPYSSYWDKSQGFRPYPEVNHPEDQPSFGASGGTYAGTQDANYGVGYGAYGANGAPAAPSVHPRLQWPLRRDNQRFNFGEAFSYGFKAVFLDPLLWILATLIYLVLTFSISFAGGNGSESTTGVTDIVIGGLSFFVTPFAYHLALRAIDGVKLSLSVAVSGIRYLPILGATIVAGIISFVAMSPMWIGLLATGFLNLDKALTEDEAITVVLQMLLWVAVGLLISLLVTPFTVLLPYYLADGHGFGESLRANFADVKRNYGSLLGFVLVAGLITGFGGLITLGLGFVILVPFYYSALAYVYRSISGQFYPTQVQAGQV